MYQECYPAFYAKTEGTRVKTDGKSSMLTKHAVYNKYNLKEIRVGQLYKPISRVIDWTQY